jgi:hypothetical protein
MAVELGNRLRSDLERPLPSTVIFEYPTIHALTDYLASEVLNISAALPSDEPASDEKQQAIRTEVEQIPEEQLEDALLKELREAGY